ncbi:MAG: hypothetical protein LBM93_09855, partial [Oscillospiraceae bacterium]|nr:hypothetical protein [Oscillospiraceae bacterium]
MASLNNISMWDKNFGWKHITADAAYTKHPYGANTHSHIFLCELCNQYANFVVGDKQQPYFRHNRNSKECEEKSTSLNSRLLTNPLRFSLPIRIKQISGKFDIQIGFLPVTDTVRDKQINSDNNIIISANGKKLREFSFERLSTEKISFLSVGSNFSEKYNIAFTKDNLDKYYFPTVVEGFNSNGTLFDNETGKKLPLNASTVINQKYILITRNYYYIHTPLAIQCKQLLSISPYTIYEIEATELSKEVSDYFLKFGGRLTNTPAELTELYPFTLKSSHVLLSVKDKTWFHKSDGYINVYPSHIKFSKSSAIIGVSNSDNQILSLSRFENNLTVLRYLYIRRVNVSEIEPKKRPTKIDICTIDDTNILHSEYQVLPKNKLLYVTLEFDGKIEI